MWSSKRNIIISISIIVLFVIFIVASLIVGLAAAFIIEKKEFKKIEDEFKQYVDNDNVIYYCNNYIYIGDRAVELANDVYVEWMNDDYILLLDTKQDIYYFIASWNNIKKIDTKKDNFNYVHSGFYYNSYVYFHH